MALKFIGYMGDPRNKIVVFSDGSPNGDLVLARKGDIIREQFRVLDIDFETVTMGYVNPKWSERRTLRMGG
jgi:hypothetical protein